jgi:transposase
MREYIGCDMHKRYSVFVAVDDTGHAGPAVRVENDRHSLRDFLEQLEPGSPVAVETTGNWYWFLDELEGLGHIPFLAHATKAKLMMGNINKTDRLDARDLGVLLRNGTLPTVWVPPAPLRGPRELLRLRVTLANMRTRVRNRIHALLAKHGMHREDETDIFTRKGRTWAGRSGRELPQGSGRCLEEQLELVDRMESHIQKVEERIRQVLQPAPEMELLMSLPGVGPILAAVIILEIGDVLRFPSPQHLASYAGTVPRVHSSGGRTRYGRTRPDVNRCLRWAFIEAANVTARHRRA